MVDYRKGEVVWFRKTKYKTNLKQATPDDLWTRECRKSGTVAGSATAVTCGSLLVLPTFGLALPGVVLSGRTLDIARTKLKLVRSELERRNLPKYPVKKRDIIIPVGLALTVFSTLGVIDIICFTGTSAPIAFDAGNSALGALQGLIGNPGDFSTGLLQGFELQGQQFFGLSGAENLAIGSQPSPVMLDAAGMHVVDSNATTMAPLTDTDLVQNGAIEVGGGVAGAKAAVADQVHQAVAIASPGGQAELLVATNQHINEAALAGNQAQVSGIAVGMLGAQAAEKQATAIIIEESGLDKVAEDVNVSAGPPSPKTGADKSVGSAMHTAFRHALSGEKPLMMVFLGTNKRPISQAIITPPSSQSCCHEKTAAKTRMCHFCDPKGPRIDIEKEAYYHCCRCSTKKTSFDICEQCVAILGCSCTVERDHVLWRKGCLGATVGFGTMQKMADSDDEDP